MNNFYKNWESLVTLQLPSCLPSASPLSLRLLSVASFSEQMNLKNKYFHFLYKPTKKRKRFHIWKCQVTMPKKGKNLLIWTSHLTMTKRNAYISNEMQLKIIFLLFFHKNKSLLSATTILSRSPMAYNTTASLDKLTCTDYVDFCKCQGRFGQFSWSKNDFNYLDVKLKVFRKGDKKVPTGPKSYNGRGKF